jgi:hypothetical protein
VTVRAAGPAIGLRWPSAPGTVVTVRCGQGVPVRVPVAPWRVVSALRGTEGLDVFVAQPCADLRIPPEAVALYLDPAASRPWLLPPEPGHRHILQAFAIPFGARP